MTRSPSTTDADNRWPDELAELLASTGTPRPVLNSGIGGNMLLHDSAWLAHAKGIEVIGATLLPMKGAEYYNAESAAKIREFNDWIRTSGEFDAVVDFNRALADPADPERLLPAFDSGDHKHPNDAGYREMAQAMTRIPLT
ncbi:GDSL-type esterase/lipase family protein [Nocardia sp. NPDC127579]|uniref:GDSL-type esterase/lipase family protein n=1 Tax=Nocardia sp. NPDC127579 TaxID=3345402 RepID=UPI00364408F8